MDYTSINCNYDVLRVIIVIIVPVKECLPKEILFHLLHCNLKFQVTTQRTARD